MNIEVRPTTTPRPRPTGALGFGIHFTDHVFRMDYAEPSGWQHARIEAYSGATLDPAASVLHYAQVVFEGLKAFRGPDGGLRLFRVDRHARRFAKSCEKLCIPAIPESDVIEAIVRVVEQDASWVPNASSGGALYVRPFVYATEAFLGVRPAKEFTFCVILSPVGAYYERGFAPVKIWVEREAVRAVKGGVGDAKTAANYAASLHAAFSAKKRGYDQVLWTDAITHEKIEEVGTMNLFVAFDDEIVTPSLDGTILDGVTRNSVLTLLRARGLKVVERSITLDEVKQGQKSGKLREIFGTGTAAVISPVGTLGFDDGDLTIGDGQPGKLALSLFDELTKIQRGEAPDPHGWVRRLEG